LISHFGKKIVPKEKTLYLVPIYEPDKFKLCIVSLT
jgi:hypothetical protein